MAISDDLAFCTPADVKAVSTIHPAFHGFDDRIKNWCRIATTMIAGSCNREFVQQDGIEEYHGTPDRDWSDLAFPEMEPYSIYLTEPNINKQSLMVFLSYQYMFTADTLLARGNNTEAASADTFDPGNAVNASPIDFQDYFIEPVRSNSALSKVVLTRRLKYHPKSVKIVYSAGYPFDDTDKTLVVVPAEIVQATAVQAGYLMSRAGNEDIGTGDVSRRMTRRDPRTTPSGVTPEANYLLRKWRRTLTASM